MASICHEMLIPVKGVLGMAKLLLDTELTAEQRECTKTLHATAESLREIINGDWGFLHREGDTLDLGIINFDLQATMDALSDSLAERVLTKGLQFACLIHPHVPTHLRGNPRRLRQILLNLSDNALKFTERGKVVIKVSPAGETDTQVTLRFAITDTGIGIPAHGVNRLFHSLFRGDGSTRPTQRGTGLGLPISKCLVQMMGGEIGVHSHEGRGSTFWFTAILGKQPPG
jgi:signal transduction histidine kinase